MAQPHKGPRDQIKTRVHVEVYSELRQIATERELSVSQLAADLLATAIGRPDLIRELRSPEEVLPLAI